MTAYYGQFDRIYVAVDCIIFGISGGTLNVLLTERSFEPYAGTRSLIGGFVGVSESIDVAARRVLRHLTGLEQVYMQQVGAFGQVDRDPGQRVISIAYYALLDSSTVDNELLASHNAVWTPISDLPPLCFDHRAMVDSALKKLRCRVITEPLVFSLLPQQFTLSRLQNLLEVITGEVFDKRNFRKRVADNPCILPTEQIDKSGSRRGARLYYFSPTEYKLNQRFKL